MRISRLLTIATVSLTAAVAAPSAHAAGPIVKLKVAGSTKLLTDNPAIGFVTMQPATFPTSNTQRWERIDGPGVFEYFRNVGTGKCLRAAPTNNTFVRTVACNVSDDAASRQQQWVLSGKQLANRDRLLNNNPANSLKADFTNINDVVGMAPFTGRVDQSWTALAG